MEVFDDILIYSEASLPLQFKEDFKDKLYTTEGTNAWHCYNSGSSSGVKSGLVPSRGFGYWCWKPKVILMALEQIKENDLLVYLDIGFEFNPSKVEILLDMLKEVNQNEIMGLEHEILEKNYQKGDTLRHFGLERDEKFLNSYMLAAGMIFLKKTPQAQQIIQEWLDIFYTHWDFVNDEPSTIPNLNFERNLHDQGIWSILNKLKQCKNFPPEYYMNPETALLCNRNKIYMPNDVRETKKFNEMIRENGFFNDHLAYKLGKTLSYPLQKRGLRRLWRYLKLPYKLYKVRKENKRK